MFNIFKRVFGGINFLFLNLIRNFGDTNRTLILSLIKKKVISMKKLVFYD